MLCKTVDIPFENTNQATVQLYIPDARSNAVVAKRPTVLVIPGGGYSFLSARETESVALRFLSLGFNAAVLFYSVKNDARFPNALCQAALAMAYLKENCETYSIDPTRIYTCGFSAGGHLALSLGVFWNQKWLAERIKKDNRLLRPTAQILCYPVVSSDQAICHNGSIQNLVGPNPTQELLDQISLEKHITANTPPTFLWTTQSDPTVPCENSLFLANALQKAGVPMEFHLYGWGRHGLSLANRVTQNKTNQGKQSKESQVDSHIASWFCLCQEWLEETFGVETAAAEE